MTTTQTFPDPRDTYEGSPLIKETPPWEKDTYGEKNKKALLPIIENKEPVVLPPVTTKKEQKAAQKKTKEKKHWGSDTETESE